MAKFNLSEAAKQILAEDSKSTFDSNIKSKMGMRGGEKAPHGEVGKNKVDSKTAYGTNDVGMIGQSPEMSTQDNNLPDYTKGTPTATPPGATPPVGSQHDGVGAAKLEGQPQQTMGRSDIMTPVKADATDYDSIRDRIMGKLAPQMMQANPGATFQSYHEDIEAIMAGEQLSEEFKQKAATIYEAAVTSRVVTVAEEIISEMEESLAEQFEEAVEEIKEDLATKVDDYLSYFVEEWAKENQIAIEKGLRAEIVEDFIDGLKNLFVEHYIDIPTEKVDIVEGLTNKVEELELQLDEQIKTAIELKKDLNEQKKIEAIYTACEGLTQTQVEKMKSLAESMEFTTEEEFADKLATLKESYFKTPVKAADNSALDEEVDIEEEKKVKNSLMEAYAQTISKTVSK
jgi:hypothetical protein